MKLIETSERFALDGALEIEDDLSRRQRILTIPSFSLVQERVMAQDADFTCAHWVFGVKLNEIWAQPGCNLPVLFWVNSPDFLKDYGYTAFLKPQKGDAVGYFLNFLNSLPSSRHWGYYLGGDKVTSKFATGDVYRHDMQKIPNDWGNEVAFFRKTRRLFF